MCAFKNNNENAFLHDTLCAMNSGFNKALLITNFNPGVSSN